MPRQPQDLTFKRKGKLFVYGLSKLTRKPNGTKVRLWGCRCDCGNIREYEAARLNQAKYVSCGCEMRRKHYILTRAAFS